MKNPFIPVDVDNPTCYQKFQICLEGEGGKKREEAYKATYMEKNPDGLPIIKNFENYFRLLCDDIKKQRKRIGGDWAIAGMVWYGMVWYLYFVLIITIKSLTREKI